MVLLFLPKRGDPEDSIKEAKRFSSDEDFERYLSSLGVELYMVSANKETKGSQSIYVTSPGIAGAWLIGYLGALPVSERMTPIRSFAGTYKFLSNFYETPIQWHGYTWPTVEHAYHAQKTTNPQWIEKIKAAPTPTIAKRIGREVPAIPNWDLKKLGVMKSLLEVKFKPDSELAAKLVKTAPRELVEGNWWGDTFWGTFNGHGENHLGKILMEIRSELIRLKDLDIAI
jgi:ribA/ribD-fused uncharacterized protein